MTVTAARIAWEARTRAGLSKRELARRAETSAATLSRYERGEVVPGFDTLKRIVAAAGWELVVSLEDPERLEAARNAEAMARLTPQQRLETLKNWDRLRQASAET